MKYQKMPEVEGLLELGDLRRSKKCTEPKVRFVLQNRKLKNLPKDMSDTRHVPHLELDLSYNKTLDHGNAFQQLANYPKGLGIIKNEIKKLPDVICSLGNLETVDLWSNGLKELLQNFSALFQSITRKLESMPRTLTVNRSYNS